MSNELPKIENTPKPVTRADVKLDPISEGRAAVDEVFRNDNLVNLQSVQQQLRPEKAIARESEVVLMMTNKVMELRHLQMQKQFFIKEAA